METINEFQHEYRFLSNFWPAEVTLDGVKYPSVEHAYVAAKTLDLSARHVILKSTPGQAKRYGRSLQLRSDWEQVKIPIMQDLVSQKFAHPDLSSKLLETGNADLIEGNTWGDTFWGVCNGVGKNHLGKILMEVRHSLAAASAAAPQVVADERAPIKQWHERYDPAEYPIVDRPGAMVGAMKSEIADLRAALQAAPVQPVAVPDGSKPIAPAHCPITGRKFWGNIDHPERGLVATYGGPFDTYSIPYLSDDNELRVERFDQDAGFEFAILVAIIIGIIILLNVMEARRRINAMPKPEDNDQAKGDEAQRRRMVHEADSPNQAASMEPFCGGSDAQTKEQERLAQAEADRQARSRQAIRRAQQAARDATSKP